TAVNVTGFPLSVPLPSKVTLSVASLKMADRISVDWKFMFAAAYWECTSSTSRSSHRSLSIEKLALPLPFEWMSPLPSASWHGGGGPFWTEALKLKQHTPSISRGTVSDSAVAFVSAPCRIVDAKA